MCETSSAEKYSRCIETIQKAPQRAIRRVVINLYQMTHVMVKHFGCFPAPWLHCLFLCFCYEAHFLLWYLAETRSILLLTIQQSWKRCQSELLIPMSFGSLKLPNEYQLQQNNGYKLPYYNFLSLDYMRTVVAKDYFVHLFCKTETASDFPQLQWAA